MAKRRKRKQHRRQISGSGVIRLKVLQDAGEAVLSSRQQTYSGPEENFLRICRRLNAMMLNRFGENANQFTPTDVAKIAIDFKLGRLDFNPEHLDSWIDIAGYGACGAEVAGAK